MKCPYCNFKWQAPIINHCPNCNKSISEEDIEIKTISKRQILLIPLKGFLAIIVLFFILGRFTLPFSNELYLGIGTALFMYYKLFFYWFESHNISLNNFFPYFKAYLFLCSLLIMFVAIAIKIFADYIAVGKTIEFRFLGAFILNYLVGFILGISLMTFYYLNVTYKEQKIARKRELLEKANN